MEINLEIFADTCRLCGKKRKRNINMFQSKFIHCNLPDKIKHIVDIDVMPDDPLPKTLCAKCLECIEKFLTFIDICHETQDKLMNQYLETVETPTGGNYYDGEISTEMDSIIIEKEELVESITELEIYADGSKPLDFDSVAQARSDILDNLSPSEIYNDSSGLVNPNEHILIINNTESQSGCPAGNIPAYMVMRNSSIGLVPLHTLQSPTNKVPIRRLTKENMFDPSVYTLPAEEEEKSTKESKENESKQKKVRFRNSPAHIVRVPVNKRVRRLVEKVDNMQYRCRVCKQMFSHNYRCEYHIRVAHTGDKPFRCEVCDKTFVAMYMLNKHRASHEEGFRHLCKVCGRGFRSANNLRDHEGTHSDTPPPFNCETCGKGFYFKTSYLGHMETHAPRTNHPCNRCNKSYKSARHLREHVLRVHDLVTRYTCTVCSKSFFRRSAFNHHERLHTSERPFSCDVCGRSFNESTNLKRHKNIHLKKKPQHTKLLEPSEVLPD